ncbi:hypothetical protein EDB19DRAFT_1215089 [Suillus lakei]|nr:hypothetical protein EDB19DRAFT_1215089 [Suillus lakei]
MDSNDDMRVHTRCTRTLPCCVCWRRDICWGLREDVSESPPTKLHVYLPSGKSAFGIMVQLVRPQYPQTSLDLVGLRNQSSSSSGISVKIAPLVLVHRKEGSKTTLAARYCLVFFSCRSHIPASALNEKFGRLALVPCLSHYNAAQSTTEACQHPRLKLQKSDSHFYSRHHPLDLDSLPGDNTTQCEGEPGRRSPLIHQGDQIMRSSILDYRQREHRRPTQTSQTFSASRSVPFAIKDIPEFPHPSSFEHHSNQLELTDMSAGFTLFLSPRHPPVAERSQLCEIKQGCQWVVLHVYMCRDILATMMVWASPPQFMSFLYTFV